MSESGTRWSPCGAKTRAGGLCSNPGTGQGGRCRFHGGKSLAGVASPTFKHGRYSKLPAVGALSEGYQKHLADMDYVALRDELALVTAQIEEAAVALAEVQAQATTPETRRLNSEEIDRQRRALIALIDQRRELARTEALRIKMAHDVLTGEQIRAFASAVLQAVRDEVGDLRMVSRIQERTYAILRTVGVVTS